MHDNYDIRQEQINKASLLSSDKFLDNLLDILTMNVVREARLTIQQESDQLSRGRLYEKPDSAVHQGPVVQWWVRANPRLKFNRCFSLCISALLIISKLNSLNLTPYFKT
jgi:hypothetical protein